MEDSKSVAETSFDEAEAHFRNWIAESGVSSDLTWVFREDILAVSGRIYLRTPIDADNYERAKACYELAQARGFGVCLNGFCLLDSILCCHLILPQDDIDAQYKLMSNVAVKYSWRTDLPQAEKTSNSLIWKLRTWQSKLLQNQTVENSDIPSKQGECRTAFLVDVGREE